MKAVIYEEKGKLSLGERPVPRILEKTDAIVRVTLASICTSDLHIKHGAVLKAKPGVVVGHEMVGVVESVGDGVKKFRPGDRVTVNVETFCGECFFCKRGYVNNCTNENGGWALGCRIDGGQAEYVRVPMADQGLNHIPEELEDRQVLFVGDILSTGYWAAKLGEIKQEDTVVVLGAGPTGMCAMMCAKLYNPRHIVAVDLDEERLKLAKQEGWADVTVQPEKEDLFQIAADLTDGRGADVVLEVAGGQDTFQTAWQVARPNGIVYVIAVYGEAKSLPFPEMYGKNLTFKTGGVDACDCERIIELIAEGKLDTTKLITHEVTLENVMEGYRIFENKEDGVIKVAVRP